MMDNFDNDQNENENQNENGELRSCKDCGDDFVFTDGEARFYAERGFDVPKRCADCRVKARERHQRSAQ